VLLGAAVLAVGALGAWAIPRALSSDGRVELAVTEFERGVARGDVDSATLYDRDKKIQGTLAGGDEYRVRFPAEYSDELTALVVDAGIDLEVESQRTSIWTALVLNVLPLILVLGLVLFVIARIYGRNVLGFGRSRARAVHRDQPDVGFADVAGLDEVVEELAEIRDFLTDPRRFEELGAKIPKGVLLYGPPGTGKTLLARAVAGEAGVPFFSISGSDFVEMFVGVGAARVRDLFKQAKADAPAIIFVDEIDAVGRHRGAGLGGGHDEREQTLNQLLVEMDGFDAGTGVILVAATNRPDILDPALLRPGRFDRQIVVEKPDLEGRKAILAVHARGKPLAPGVDLGVVARRTPGFTGADLANLVNEAALLAARRGFGEVGMPQLEEAIERVLAGPERRTRVMSEHEQRVIAYHEAGHAIVGHALPSRDPVHKISIIPRGRALGYTLVLPTEDRVLTTQRELRDQIAMLLGGRTAEELTFDDPTTGAFDDIERATHIARRMVTEFGMSEVVGPMRLGANSQEVFVGRDMKNSPEYSEEVAARIDAEVRAILDGARETARSILVAHRITLERLASALLQRETLDAPEVAELLADVPKWTDEESGPAGAAVAAANPPPTTRRSPS
jgi:cell division protease FtsH